MKLWLPISEFPLSRITHEVLKPDLLAQDGDRTDTDFDTQAWKSFEESLRQPPAE